MVTRSRKLRSAGLVLFRDRDGRIEILLVHPGGPFWQKRDEGAWSIPKGEVGDDEDGIGVARREFQEELGIPAPVGPVAALGGVRQPGGKSVDAWALRGDLDVTSVSSNTFVIEWPPRSGKRQTFPEVDRAAWFDLETARRKILAGQRPFIDRLEASL